MNLAPEEHTMILQLVRTVLAREVVGDHSVQLPLLPDSGILREHCGVFVSLYVRKKLRGCIGTFSEDDMLYDSLRDMAVSAATCDSRFRPVKPGELEYLQIEVSILTPRRKISDTREIILGTHGIYIRSGTSRGTLLPQVAIQQRWSVDEFLGNCAKYKAGIGWDGWKNADLYIYEAIVIRSEELPGIC